MLEIKDATDLLVLKYLCMSRFSRNHVYARTTLDGSFCGAIIEPCAELDYLINFCGREVNVAMPYSFSKDARICLQWVITKENLSAHRRFLKILKHYKIILVVTILSTSNNHNAQVLFSLFWNGVLHSGCVCFCKVLNDWLVEMPSRAQFIQGLTTQLLWLNIWICNL